MSEEIMHMREYYDNKKQKHGNLENSFEGYSTSLALSVADS
jgi:hypothetical protein